MKENKKLDELFRQKLLNYEQEPPAYLLENILAGAAAARRKRKLVYWRVAGVAAALLLAFVAGWQFNAADKHEFRQAKTIEIQTVPKNGIQPENENLIRKANTEKSRIATVAEPSATRENNSASEEVVSQNGTISSTPEPGLIASGNNHVQITPLQKLSGIIRQVRPVNYSLHEMKGKDVVAEPAEKSIDQQIMEQNHRQLMAENKSARKTRWMVGAQISPDYTVSRSAHSQTYESNMLNSSSANPVDLGAGISVEYKKGKRWSLQSGVYYAGLGESSGNSSGSGSRDYMYADLASGYFNTPVNIDASTNKMMMNSSAGVIELNTVPTGTELATSPEEKIAASSVILSQASFVQNFEYIEIPLYLRYTILDSRFDVEMLGGFSSNILVGNSTYMESSSGKSLVGKTRDMESLNYSGTLGLGFKYGLSKRVFLNVEPRIKYYLNSLNGNSSVTYKPYTIGVFTGLSYQF